MSVRPFNLPVTNFYKMDWFMLPQAPLVKSDFHCHPVGVQSPLATVTNKRAVIVVKNARLRMREYFIGPLEKLRQG